MGYSHGVDGHHQRSRQEKREVAHKGKEKNTGIPVRVSQSLKPDPDAHQNTSPHRNDKGNVKIF